MDVIVRTKVTKAKPQPANPPAAREVVLMCESCRSFMPHKFVDTRRVNMAVFEEIYGCISCKAERRYGLLA